MEALLLPGLAFVLILLFWIRVSTQGPAPEIRVDSKGIYFTEARSAQSLAWNEIDKITLEWEENPWGDPMVGDYCDTDWVLRGKQRLLRIAESSPYPNNRVLIPAMKRYLPGFRFSYTLFDLQHKGRVFDLKGGKVTVWERPS